MLGSLDSFEGRPQLRWPAALVQLQHQRTCEIVVLAPASLPVTSSMAAMGQLFPESTGPEEGRKVSPVYFVMYECTVSLHFCF